MIDQRTKLEGLRTVAKAFHDRGACIQYDQLSMDRVWRVTPRRQRFAAPEQATGQNTLFLDCSSFVFAVFNQAFGYHMEADLTKDMMNLENIRRFHYIINKSETEQEKLAVLSEFKQCLEPGDVVVYVYEGNGHTLLYVGDGKLYHCSTNGAPGSYDYEARHDNTYPWGAIKCVDYDILFTPLETDAYGRNYLLNPKNKAFCILRPFDEIENVTTQTQLRMHGLSDLRIEVNCSHPEGQTAVMGGEIKYTLEIVNLGDVSRTAELKFNDYMQTVEVQPNIAQSFSFSMLAHQSIVQDGYITPPEISVNDVLVYAPRVLLGVTRNNDYLTQPDPEKALDAIFELIRNQDGEVYQLRKLLDEDCGLVPGLFGGFGVISPDIEDESSIRIHKMSASALRKWDVIVYRDKFSGVAKSAVYLGDGLLEGMDRANSLQFIDSLFGRFCFAVLRGFNS